MSMPPVISVFYAEEGKSLLSFNFLVSQYQNIPKDFVSEPFSVSLISDIEKVWIRGGGEYQNFPSKFFCLRVPKNFVGESLTVALISDTEKV